MVEKREEVKVLDDRQAIKVGSNLIIDENKKYTIVEEIGRGASCIVYEASYLDTVKQKHFVRIKECYPSNIRVERNAEGYLDTIEAYQTHFLEAKKEFKETYEKSVYFKTIQGLTNSIVSTIDLYMLNNTYYVIMICVEGQDYRKQLEEPMTMMFSRLLTLAKVIKKYHDNGLLYLDIKPENMWLIPETKEHIVLFDFNSIVAKEELKKDTVIKGHTMTVELIAKYLRTSEETPKTLLHKLMQKEGITSTEEIDVKHRKNKKLKADSINNHLLTLFDLR